MSAIQEMFRQAQLAEASYADFSNPNISQEQALINGKFSPVQAASFVTQWRVESQYTAPFAIGVLGTGFSGTLFQNIQTGVYALAIRGTNDVLADLFGADLGDIVADGIAIDQVVDMYNYWQSLTHSGSYQAKRLVTLATETGALNAAYVLGGPAGLAYEAQLRARSDIVIDYPSRTVRAVQTVDSTQLSDPRLHLGSERKRYRSRFLFQNAKGTGVDFFSKATIQ